MPLAVIFWHRFFMFMPKESAVRQAHQKQVANILIQNAVALRNTSLVLHNLYYAFSTFALPIMPAEGTEETIKRI